MATVTLHIYDVSTVSTVKHLNHIFRAVGTGAFHAAVEVYGQEWSYGYNDDGSTGVFGNVPKSCEEHQYREAIPMGSTQMSEDEVNEVIRELQDRWPGDGYDLLSHNCCHFSDSLCQRLGVGPIPGWVLNLAGAGASLNHGFQTLASGAKAAAVIAGAKAGHVDEQYARGKIGTTARELLDKAGNLAGNVAVTVAQLDVSTKAQQAGGMAIDFLGAASSTAAAKASEIDSKYGVSQKTSAAIQQAGGAATDFIGKACGFMGSAATTAKPAKTNVD